MNSLDPSSGGGAPVPSEEVSDEELREIAEEIKRLATDKLIEETASTEIADDTEDGFAKAEAWYFGYSDGHKAYEDSEGRIIAEQYEKNDDGGRTEYEMVFIPRTSSAWNEIYESFAEVSEAYELFVPLRPSYLDAALEQIQQTKAKLRMDPDIVGEFDDTEGRTEIGNESGEAEFGIENSHEDIYEVEQALRECDAEVARVFNSMYRKRYPGIVERNFQLAEVLHRTLEGMQVLLLAGREDARDVGRKTIAALEALDASGGPDDDMSVSLAVVSAVASVAGAALVPISFGASVSFVVAAGVANVALGAHQEDEGGEPVAPDLSTDTVRGVISNMHGAHSPILSQIRIADQKNAEALAELAGWVTSGSTETVNIANHHGLEASVQVAHFQFPIPSLEGPQLSDIPEGNLSDSEIQSDDYMGSDIDVDLDYLHEVGDKYLPDLAADFTDAAGGLPDSDSTLYGAYEVVADSGEGGGGSGAVSVSASMSPPWENLRDALHENLTVNADALEVAGQALVQVAAAFGYEDTAMAQSIRRASEGE